MFYDIFEDLCKKNGTSPFACCKEIGLSGGTAAYWKKAGKPPKLETLEKIAAKFGVSVDYLLGRNKNATDNNVDRKSTVFISYYHTDADIAQEVAKCLSELSDDKLKQVYNFAKFLSEQQDQGPDKGE